MARSALAGSLLALPLAIADGAAAATTATWLGGSGSWSDAFLWSTNPVVPCNGNGGQDFDVSIAAGTATLDAACAIEAMSLASGTVAGSGELTVNELFTWNSGAMSGTGTTRVKSGIALPTFNTRALLGGRVLVLEGGTTEFTGTGELVLGTGGATLRNEAGSTLLFSVGGAAIRDTSAAGTFVNEGTVTVAVPAISGVSILPASLAQNGALHVSSGSLLLNAGATHTGIIDGAGTLKIGGLNQSFLAGSSITVARLELLGGTVIVQAGATIDVGHLQLENAFVSLIGAAAVSTGTMTMASGTLSGAGTLESSGLFTWSGGTLGGSGTHDAAGGIAIHGNATRSFAGTRVLRIGGSGAWSGGNLALGSGGATLRVVPGGTLIVTGTTRALTSSGGSGHFVNEGTMSFDLATSDQTLDFTTGTFENAGTLELKRGTLQLQGAVTQTAGVLRLASGSLASASPIALQAGALEGYGTLDADVTCACTVAPGLPYGVLVVNGDLTLLAGSELRVDVHELDPNPRDEVQVTDTASLAGRLAVSLQPELEASMQPEHSVTILEAGAPLTGGFTNVASGQRVITTPGRDSMVVHYGAGAPTGAERVVLTDFRAFEPAVRLGIMGASQGGAITLRISGIDIVVVLTPGMTSVEIAEAIAAAIHANDSLAALGIAAFATRNSVATNGTLDQQPDVSDPGIEVVELSVPALPLAGVCVLAAAMALAARRARLRASA